MNSPEHLEMQEQAVWERGPIKIFHRGEDHHEIEIHGIRARTRGTPDFASLEKRFKGVAFGPWMTRYLETLLVAYKTGQHRAIMAPSGTGKSWGPRVFAALMGTKLSEAALGPTANEADFYGGYAPNTAENGGEYRYVRGPVLQAAEKGHIAVGDEGLKMSLSVRARLLGLLEAPNTPGIFQKTITLPTGEEISVKEGFVLFWTGRPPESEGDLETPLTDEEQRRTPIFHAGNLSEAESKLRRSSAKDRSTIEERYPQELKMPSEPWSFRLGEKPLPELPDGLSLLIGAMIDVVQQAIMTFRDNHTAQKFQPLHFINLDQRIIEMMSMVDLPSHPEQRVESMRSAFHFFLQTYYADAFDPDKKTPGGKETVGTYLRGMITAVMRQQEVRNELEKIFGLEAKLELENAENVTITATGKSYEVRAGTHRVILRNTGNMTLIVKSIHHDGKISSHRLGQLRPLRADNQPNDYIYISKILPGNFLTLDIAYKPSYPPANPDRSSIIIQSSVGMKTIPLTLAFKADEAVPRPSSPPVSLTTLKITRLPPDSPKREVLRPQPAAALPKVVGNQTPPNEVPAKPINHSLLRRTRNTEKIETAPEEIHQLPPEIPRSIDTIEQLPEGTLISFQELENWMRHHDLEPMLNTATLRASITDAEFFYSKLYEPNHSPLFEKYPVYRIRSLKILKQALQEGALGAAMVLAYPNFLQEKTLSEPAAKFLHGMINLAHVMKFKTNIPDTHDFFWYSDSLISRAIPAEFAYGLPLTSNNQLGEELLRKEREKQGAKLLRGELKIPRIFFYPSPSSDNPLKKMPVITSTGTMPRSYEQKTMKRIIEEKIQIPTLEEALVLAKFLKAEKTDGTMFSGPDGVPVAAFGPDTSSENYLSSLVLTIKREQEIVCMDNHKITKEASNVICVY